MKEYEKNEVILENHLHQQYAENDNNRSGVFTSFIIGIIALFGFYGYVFVNTNCRKYWNFNIQEFLLMSFVTIGILFFLSLLSLFYGYSLRRDHLIVYNIRKKRYKNKEEMKKIFGKLYDPRRKNFCNFLPDFYNLFYSLFLFSEIFLHITAVLKINDIKNTGNSFCENINLIYVIMLLHVIFIISTFKFRIIYYWKYKQSIQRR